MVQLKSSFIEHLNKCHGIVNNPVDKEKLVKYVGEWLDEMDVVYSDKKTTDTFTQHYYDLFCESMKRDNKR